MLTEVAAFVSVDPVLPGFSEHETPNQKPHYFFVGLQKLDKKNCKQKTIGML